MTYFSGGVVRGSCLVKCLCSKMSLCATHLICVIATMSFMVYPIGVSSLDGCSAQVAGMWEHMLCCKTAWLVLDPIVSGGILLINTGKVVHKCWHVMPWLFTNKSPWSVSYIFLLKLNYVGKYTRSCGEAYMGDPRWRQDCLWLVNRSKEPPGGWLRG